MYFTEVSKSVNKDSPKGRGPWDIFLPVSYSIGICISESHCSGSSWFQAPSM